MALQRILELTKTLTDEEYKEMFESALKQERPIALKKEVYRRMQTVGKRMMKAEGGTGVPGERNPPGCPDQPKPSSSLEPSKAAFKSPFIYRSDLVPSEGLVFFDVEKLSLKLDTNTKHKMVASSVAIVNDNNDIILWSFVKWDNICQTFPKLTGITKEKLEIGMESDCVKTFVDLTFRGNVAVGWNLDDDLKALSANPFTTTIDLADYFIDENKQPYKLKDTWKHFYGKQIQCGIHTAIQDARATRNLYFKMEECKKKYPDDKTYPIPIERSPREPFQKDPSDVCKCAQSKKKKPKQNQFFLPK